MNETGESILKAAMMLFAEKGFAGTTTRQIAQQAGVNEVTLFRHFRSKTELFNRILEEIQRIYPPLLALDQVGETSPEDVLIEYCLLTLRRCREAPHLIRLLLYAMLDEVHELRDNLIEKRLATYHELLRDAFARLQRDGACKSDEAPDVLSRLLISQVFGLGMMSLCHLEGYDIQEEERLARQITSQFVGTPRSEAPVPLADG
ncbi:MAG: TetR/AcrR family transcriptional regulator [SAR324 cluster bacterium]|nr:TetR/AcrR family transcriptional regulator [SAR324 cluster bacterium]